MQLLIDNGADTNSVDGNSQTPLHILCSKPKGTPGVTECVTLLIDSYRADPNTIDGFGSSPLHLAVTNGHVQVTSILVAAGSDLTALDKNGNNALHLAAVVGELGCMQAIVLAQSGGVDAEHKHKGLEDVGVGPVDLEQEPKLEMKSDVVIQAAEGPSQSPWVPCTTESGNVYYYNASTGKSSWENPFPRDPPAPEPPEPEQGGTLVSPAAVVAKPSPIYPIDTDDFTDADDHEIMGTTSPTSINATNKDMDDTHMAIWNKVRACESPRTSQLYTD